MGLFSNLKKDGLEEAKDSLGGNFAARETGIYTGKLTAAYLTIAGSGAQAINLVFNDGTEYREAVYITNKKGENFFTNQQNKKVPLPGFTVADDICLIATGEPLSAQEPEDKVIKVYDFEAKGEVQKSVEMITAAIGKKVSLGVIRQLVNKNEKSADGVYVATAETREENFIDKVFHPDHKVTVVEARNGQEEGKFWDGWLERNKGQTRDKRTVKEGEAGSKTPPKAAPGAAAAPRKSLFGPK